MLLDRHRLTRLMELADSERRITGPERLLREEDVAILVKAAYDDATDAARAAFMARVKQMPTSAWPWSAVQAATPRSGGVVYSPGPDALAPAALLLLRGQANSTDADPGNRVPDRERPEGAIWEPLHKALDLWDTATIKKWIAPQGWMVPRPAVAIQPAKNTGVKPVGGVVPPPVSKPTDSGGKAPGGLNGSGPTAPDSGTPTGDVPGQEPTPTADQAGFSWRHPAVIAAGATALTTVGVVLFGLSSRRSAPEPEEAPGS